MTRDELIVQFLPLAHRLARRYRGSGEPLDDLVQIASLGLVKAATRFDPTRGGPFVSFAAPTIVGELNRYVRDCTWALHVDRRAKQRARETSAAQRTIAAALGRRPRVAELAEHLDLPVEAVLDGLLASAARETLSLDAPLGDGDAGAEVAVDHIGEEDEGLEQVPDVATVFAAARRLSRRERLVLYLRFGEDLSQTEIARRMGISQMHVSRIIRGSLERLRETCEDAAAA